MFIYFFLLNFNSFLEIVALAYPRRILDYFIFQIKKIFILCTTYFVYMLRPELKPKVDWILDVRETVSWLYQVGKAW